MAYGYPPPPPQFPQQGLPHVFQPNPADTVRPLAIAYIVYAIFVGIAALFVPVYFAIAVAAVASASQDMPSGDAGPMMAFGGAMIVIIALIELVILVKLTLLVLAARNLFRTKNYGLCFAAAIVSCLNIPLGLGLGIWSFFVLSRPKVKAAFT